MDSNKIKIVVVLTTIFFSISCVGQQQDYKEKSIDILKDSILRLAEQQMEEPPVTVTASNCERSAGGVHDFYSEGDYWWPDPENPDGPYIRKDGKTNPNNFTDHRKAMVRLSQLVGNFGSAYIITKDKKYAEAIKKHTYAWFVNPKTKMNPNLLYAQAIKGRHTGRGIGIIDAIHLMEVVRTITILEKDQLIEEKKLSQIKQWFSDFVTWLTTHEYGLKEMIHPNNHGTCWNMQVGMYAKFIGNEEIYKQCQERYMNKILPSQMAENGSFPLEMERTKPYGYALFNLDAMTMNCLILSDVQTDLWNYTTEDGKTIKKALEFMAPFVADKASWPLEPDVMYWENWPIAHPSFLFGAIQFKNEGYFKLWAKNKHFLEVREVIRNVPIRNPLIWLY